MEIRIIFLNTSVSNKQYIIYTGAINSKRVDRFIRIYIIFAEPNLVLTKNETKDKINNIKTPIQYIKKTLNAFVTNFFRNMKQKIKGKSSNIGAKIAKFFRIL